MNKRGNILYYSMALLALVIIVNLLNNNINSNALVVVNSVQQPTYLLYDNYGDGKYQPIRGYDYATNNNPPYPAWEQPAGSWPAQWSVILEGSNDTFAQTATDSYGKVAIAGGDTNWTNYTFEADVKYKNAVGTGLTATGLWSSLTQYGGYVFLIIHNQGMQQWALFAGPNAPANYIQEVLPGWYLLAYGPYSMPEDTWVNVKISDRAGNFKIYLDNNLVSSLYDATYSGGLVGVGGAGEEDYFRNVKVYAVGTSATSTSGSITSIINNLINSNCFANAGIAQSVQSKINNIQAKIATGQIKVAQNVINALIHELNAQSGKNICADGAASLINTLTTLSNSLNSMADGQITPITNPSNISKAKIK